MSHLWLTRHIMFKFERPFLGQIIQLTKNFNQLFRAKKIRLNKTCNFIRAIWIITIAFVFLGWDAFIQWALEHIRGKKQSANQRRASTLSPGNSKVGQDHIEEPAADQEMVDQVQLENHHEVSQRTDRTKAGGDNLPGKSNKIRHHSIVIVDNERGNGDQSELDVPQQHILTDHAKEWSPKSSYQSQV